MRLTFVAPNRSGALCPLAVDFTLRAKVRIGRWGLFSRSQRNDGCGADYGPSRGDRRRRAFRSIEISISQIRNVRLQSIPAVWSMQIAVTPDKLANGPNRPTATSCAQLVNRLSVCYCALDRIRRGAKLLATCRRRAWTLGWNGTRRKSRKCPLSVLAERRCWPSAIART